MKRVEPADILSLASYDERRDGLRQLALEVKKPRRIHVAGVLTFLFENPFTVRYQIQEMLRAERITRESDVLQEIETYNELLGQGGELGCTLLIELTDPEERREKLTLWRDLPERLYLRMEDGSLVRPRFDERQRGELRLSSVQYLKFDVGGTVPVAAGVDLPDLRDETPLTSEQRRALAEDLGVSSVPAR